jgi:hypothetical protein
MTLEELKKGLKGDSFFLPSPGVSLSDLANFLAWVDKELFDNNLGLKDLLPDALTNGSAGTISLASLFFAKKTAEKPTLLRFQLRWDLPPTWEIVPGEFAIKDIEISIEISGAHASAKLSGTMAIEDLTLVAEAEFPSLYVKAQLQKPEEGDPKPSPNALFNRFPVGKLEGKAGGPTLTDLLLLADVRNRRVVLHLGLADIQVGPVDAAFQLELNYDSKPKGQLTGLLWSEYLIERAGHPDEPVKIAVMAAHEAPEAGWQFEGAVSVDDLPLGELVAHFEKEFKIKEAIPPSLTNLGLNIKLIQVAFNTATKDFSFAFDLDFFAKKQKGNAQAGNEVEMIVQVDMKRAADGSYNKHISGQLIFHVEGQVFEFDLVFDDNPQETSFLAVYKNLGGGQLDIGALVKTIDSSIDFPLSISLKDAFFVYENIKGQPNGSAGAENNQTNPGSRYLFGLDIGGGINLSGLPLVGKMFSKTDNLRLNFQPLIASGPQAPFFKGERLQSLAGLIPGGGVTLPSADLSTNVELSVELDAGGSKFSFALPIGISKDRKQLQDKGGPVPAPVPAKSAPTPAAAAPAQPPAPLGQSPAGGAGGDSVTWFDLQKSFGPVAFNRLGFKYKGGEVWVMMDAALMAGGLTLSLDGLGLGVNIAKIGKEAPDFTLSGLGIDIKEGPVEIGGSFLREHIPAAGDLPAYDEYDGMVVLNFQEVNISAIGSYARVNGHASLFIYGLLEMPLGGPPFFFVTGLAAGFGFNRKLKMPAIGQVQQFPLVLQASRNLPQPPATSNAARRNVLQQEMTSLRKYIPPSIGEYFLAVGVKYTSFELIDAFALVAVSFGKHFEVDILGLSTLVLPTPETSTAVPPLAEVQMAVKAVFDPEAGYLSVQAQLTSSSFLFSRDCHLTGGFAFFVWFKDQDNGAHAGDFVLSLGGYHPDFKPPAYYPVVPRLGFNWQVVPNELFIKGDFYFALVSHAVMAGGHLEAVWQSGDIKAWFKAGADFLLSWKPYFYKAHMYLDMGVSLTLHVFGTHHITIDLGADLKVWGPEFTGIAKIHLWIVSFTVKFGDATPKPQPISWVEFRQSFLPGWDKMCSVQVQAGLVKKIEKTANTPERWVVNPKEMVLITNTQVPATQAVMGKQKPIYGPAFGVAPMALEQVTSSVHTVQVKRDNAPIDKHFLAKPIEKNVPAAMWGDKLSPEVNGTPMIPNALSGLVISPATPAKANETHAVQRKNLAYDIQAVESAFEWAPIHPFADGENQDRSWLAGHLMDAKTVTNRNALLQELGFNLDTQGISIDPQLAYDLVETPQIGAWAA